MRRGKHTPKHIHKDPSAIAGSISRLGVTARCQVVLHRNGRLCGAKAKFYGRAVRPTQPPTPRTEVFLCQDHAQDMRDLYGYEVYLLTGQYALLA